MQHNVRVVRKSSSDVFSASTMTAYAEGFIRVTAVVLDFMILFSKIIFITLKESLRSLFPKPKKDLIEEIVLITGSGHGVGRQLAIDTAKLGAKVVLWDINEENVKKVAEEIKANGGKAWWYICDVTSEEDVKSKAKAVVEEVGDVTILINNAGIMQNVPLLELDGEKIKRTFQVNSLAHFWTIRQFLPKMKENNHGHIVAISSAAGLIGHVNQSDYSASKFAVVGMMEALSEEMRLKGCQVKFTTICPLTVDTGMNHHPVARYPLLTPILSIKEASEQILNAVRTEEFLVTLPSSSGFFLLLSKLFPRQVMCEVMDYLEYCRMSNAVPKIAAGKEKVTLLQ